MKLTEEQIERYARHIVLKEVGGIGQGRLLQARVLCIGAGGLGCPAAIYLAAAGVGILGVIDDDPIALSNLHRQFLHKTADVGTSKVESIEARVKAINPDTRVHAYAERLDESNIRERLEQYDIILDGTDNFATRFLVADACWGMGKTLVTGSVFQFEGQVTTVVPSEANPCYRCLYPQPPPAGLFPSCAEAGVLGPVAGTIGSLQATECLKLILDSGSNLVGRLLVCDALAGEWRTLSYEKSKDCALCGPNPSIHEFRAGQSEPAAANRSKREEE